MEQPIAAGLTALGLDPVKAKPLSEYGALLLEWNRSMNLTAITDPAEVALFHMLDCAALGPALAPYAPEDGPVSLVDVGTGAGFPGLVLAILYPRWQVVLLDPLEKRLSFLQAVCKALSLDNVTTLHARAEDAGHDPACRERFHFATARAVASARVLSELCLPLVRPGGLAAFMKSDAAGPELLEAGRFLEGPGSGLGGRPLATLSYTLPPASPGPTPTPSVSRQVLLLSKAAPTAPEFPRRWAKIARENREKP